MTHASHALPSSHSRRRTVRARIDGRIEPRTVVAECALDEFVEPDWLARDADRKQLLACPELFGRELERLEHAEPQLPFVVHASDKHRRRCEHNRWGAVHRGYGFRFRDAEKDGRKRHGRMRVRLQPLGSLPALADRGAPPHVDGLAVLRRRLPWFILCEIATSSPADAWTRDRRIRAHRRRGEPFLQPLARPLRLPCPARVDEVECHGVR